MALPHIIIFYVNQVIERIHTYLIDGSVWWRHTSRGMCIVWHQCQRFSITMQTRRHIRERNIEWKVIGFINAKDIVQQDYHRIFRVVLVSEIYSWASPVSGFQKWESNNTIRFLPRFIFTINVSLYKNLPNDTYNNALMTDKHENVLLFLMAILGAWLIPPMTKLTMYSRIVIKMLSSPTNSTTATQTVWAVIRKVKL